MLVTAVLVGCDATKTSDEDIDRIEYAQVRRLLDNSAKEKAVLVDVRPASQYQAEHLPGAINIPLPQIVSRDGRLAEARRIIVYGNDFRDPLSPAAAKKMIVLGYRNVHDFRGGLAAWKESGGLTESVTAADDAPNPDSPPTP